MEGETMTDRRVDGPRAQAVAWLLSSDPAIPWQAMRDVAGESEDAADRERAKVATEGSGRALLDRQRADGRWGDGSHAPQWQSTLGAMVLLCEMGLDPACDAAQRAIGLVEERVTWGPEFGDAPSSRVRSSRASTGAS